MPIPQNLCVDVSQARPDAAGILLSLIHSQITLTSTTSAGPVPTQRARSDDSNGRIQPSKSNGRNKPIVLPEVMDVEGVKANAIVVANPKAAELVSSTGSAPDSRLDENLGKVAVLKTLCAIFGLGDTSLNFNRGSYSAAAVRDKLGARLEGMTFDEVDRVPDALGEKEADLLDLLHHSPPTDIHLLFDTLLPCLISFDAMSKAFMVVSSTLTFCGYLFQRAFPRSGDAFYRLSSSKDYPSFLHQLCHLDKIPHVAKILNAFIGSDVRDQDRVGILLGIKEFMNRDNLHPPPNYPSNRFIYLLSALSFLPSPPSHGSTRQYTTLHLSECLTILNAYKHNPILAAGLLSLPDSPSQSPVPQRSLSRISNYGLASNSMCGGGAIIPSVPAMEVSAAFLVLASIVRAGVPIDHRLVEELLDQRGGTFMKIIMDERCPGFLQKAFAAFVASVLGADLGTSGDGEGMRNGQVKGLSSAAGAILKWFMGDALRVVRHIKRDKMLKLDL
ncbi:hypothetical protein HK104_000800 [Borealophlyctis nickersoniae]|nr:hypothetical protein HK104_000800 [Borealophlyctis nickersoniae]